MAETVTVDVDGNDRDFLIRTPDADGNGERPVIIALHGAGGTAADFENYTQFSSYVDADDFIAVYPNGSTLPDNRQVWNAGGCCVAAGTTPVDDVAYISAILDLLPDYGADMNRIYLAGYSNGGMFSYRLACDLGEQIAGIAVDAGAYNVLSCESTRAIPVLIFHGTADPVVPYNGGLSSIGVTEGVDPFTNSSVAEAAAIWAQRNECVTEPVQTQAGTVTRSSFEGCTEGSSLEVFTIDGGAHVWFQGDVAVDTTATILETFITTG
ncbi:MAG: lipoprotein [Glaciihabitans sp.]|nr:lipoprotein [Glaciihabitans sp.]